MSFAQTKQYYKDLIKFKICAYCTKLVGRLYTPMQQVMLQLTVRELLPERIDALEMFGMHGLWHTMDYLDYVDTLDFFELESVYCDFAKKNLCYEKVNFFCEDSIKYIKNTSKKYSFIVSDNPYGADFINDDGSPKFLNDIIKIAKDKAIIIFNMRNKYIQNYYRIRDEINMKRKCSDIFCVSRNKQVSYIVVVLDK